MARCCEVGIGAFIQTITAICFMSTILLVFQCFVLLLSSHSAKSFVADVYWASAKSLVAGDLRKKHSDVFNSFATLLYTSFLSNYIGKKLYFSFYLARICVCGAIAFFVDISAKILGIKYTHFSPAPDIFCEIVFANVFVPLASWILLKQRPFEPLCNLEVTLTGIVYYEKAEHSRLSTWHD